jgi:CBS domain-containing protein
MLFRDVLNENGRRVITIGPEASVKEALALFVEHNIGSLPVVEAEKAFDLFVATYRVKYPRAVECLEKNSAELLSFFGFPAEHWLRIWRTKVIESVFATARLCHDQRKWRKLWPRTFVRDE